jgi:hypothetical protein
MTTQDPAARPPTGPTDPQQSTYSSASPPSPPTPRGAGSARGRHGLIPIAVAALALVVASASALVSWRAIDRANDARDIALARGGQGGGAATSDPSAGPSTAGPASTEPSQGLASEPADPEATGSVPVLNEQTKYEIRYAKQPLQIQAACNMTVNLDLDEPRVQVDDSIAELLYMRPCSSQPATLTLTGGAQGSEVDSPDSTPAECVDKIRTSPIGIGVALPIRRGRVFCIMTSLNTARERADTWKIVVLETSAVGEDGTVGLDASAWNIPI